jgi:PTS system N-acetylglucosamine-specific IIC component
VKPLAMLQPLGRALMLPIAVLPVAAILLRLGQPDLLNIGFIAAAGDAIFSNLGLLFAIGVAVGLARENHGAAGLAGLVCFLVATKGAQALITVPASELKGLAGPALELAAASFKDKAIAKLGVPAGIISGLIAGASYNRFSDIRLPDYLAFFGGRRFVPIVAGLAGLGLALVLGLGWPYAQAGMDAVSRAVLGAGPVGLFLYGFLNRLLIVTGLHHVLNNLAWFILGDFHGATGDLKRFFAGDPTAGSFMAGFFPVMMFGLPAACLAIYHTARPERRKAVGGMLLSMSLTAFLTGVTEPIEFTFMFLAPLLFAIHAVLTGIAMALMDQLHVKLGFGFSAGLFDYVLNFNKATRPLLLIPVGLVYGAVYYGLFRFFILRFNLKTPGREPADAAPVTAPQTAGGRAAGFVQALGGAGNLRSVNACTTRLRLVLADGSLPDEAALKALGARGVVRPGPNELQVVLGPIADGVAGEMREWIRTHPEQSVRIAATPAPSTAATGVELPTASRPDLDGLLAALGGPLNVASAEGRASRLLVRLRNDGQADVEALKRAGVRTVARPPTGGLHLVIGPGAEDLAHRLADRLPLATDA